MFGERSAFSNKLLIYLIYLKRKVEQQGKVESAIDIAKCIHTVR